MEKLDLEDALEDFPQTRNLLGVFERDSDLLRSYVLNLHRCCNRVLTAQKELCAATQFLSSHLKLYEQQRFPLESEESMLTSVLGQFATYMDELSSIQQIMIAQLSDGMMHPVNKFLQADVDEVVRMREMFQIASADHERALAAYMKYPKKREGEKGHQEAIDDLYVSRKKFHQTAVHYYSLLNSLQYKRRCSLLEPVIGFVQAQKTFFEMGNETLSRKDFDDFVANISASVQSVHSELRLESQRRVEQIENIEKQSIHKYFAEVPSDMPCPPPNTELSQKAGYLFMRVKLSLLTSRWDRSFFFIQGGNLMNQLKDEVAGSLLLDLNIETRIDLVDVEDRRFVFQVSQPSSKRSLILQAENGRDRDEWIATIVNVVRAGQRLESTEPLTPPIKTPPDVGFTPGFFSSAPVAVPKAVEALKESSLTVPSAAYPATPSSTPAEGAFSPDAPIQFDLTTPGTSTSPKEGPPKRINPFNQPQENSASDGATAPAAGDGSTFAVRFLGSQQVLTDRGEVLLREVIRHIMAARAIHNIFKMSEFQLIITNNAVRLYDTVGGVEPLQIPLEHISYWGVHSDNKRLFGFIARVPGASGASFYCYIFECDSSGEPICQALTTSTQLAFQAFMQQKTLEMEAAQEKELLLANIEKLPDLQEQNASQSPSAEATCDIPNADAAKSDPATAPATEASSGVDGESTVTTSQNGTVDTPSESAP